MALVGHEEVLGQAAVDPQSATAAWRWSGGGVLAVGVHPESTPSAVTAPPASVDGDWLADLQTGDVGAEGGDPPGVLVPQGERRIPRQLAGLEVVHQVQVGVAGA